MKINATREAKGETPLKTLGLEMACFDCWGYTTSTSLIRKVLWNDKYRAETDSALLFTAHVYWPKHAMFTIHQQLQ